VENFGNGPGDLAMMNRFQVQAGAVYADGAYAPVANSETWQRDVDEELRDLDRSNQTDRECQPEMKASRFGDTVQKSRPQ
jgi:hypothetical protein